MDLHAQMLLDEYDELYPTLEKLHEIVLGVLNDNFKEKVMMVDSIGSRIKQRASLQKKLELKGQKYDSITDVTDLVGGRVITFYADGVDRVAATISEIFNVDWQNTVDKRKSADVDRFGYTSLHYICTLPEKVFKSDEYPRINEIRFEIQMRTVLQHAWASISHDTGYKNDIEVPKEVLRSLNSLAGLLEIADNQFLKLRNDLDEYRRNIKSIVASGNYEDVELNIESFNAFIQSGAFNTLNKRIAHINNMDIEETPYTPYLSVLKSIRIETLGDLNRLIKNYHEDAYQLALRQFNDTDIDIISSTIGLLNLIYVFILKSGLGEKGIVMLLNFLYGERPVNDRLAKRVIENAKNAGII
ncbi:MAG: (p)ppGpp synthetase [Bacilli bacterium]|nr:(p)ppGpp synthetase [Bacilli bacterium]